MCPQSANSCTFNKAFEVVHFVSHEAMKLYILLKFLWNIYSDW